jgi:hypothetical protein
MNIFIQGEILKKHIIVLNHVYMFKTLHAGKNISSLEYWRICVHRLKIFGNVCSGLGIEPQ